MVRPRKDDMNQRFAGRTRRIYTRLPFHYAWAILALVYFSILTSSGILSAASLLIIPLENNFGWTRAAISSVVSVNLLVYGAGALTAGRMIDKSGPRRVVLGSLAILAAGVASLLFMRSFWQLFILWGIVIALGSAGLSSVLPGPVVNRWFRARRGLSLGMLNSAAAAGQVIFQPLLLLVIAGFGWRKGLAIMIPITLISFIFSLFWLRDTPGEAGLRPYGENAQAKGPSGNTEKDAGESDPAEVKIGEVLRHPSFWFLVAIYAVCGDTALGLVGTHLIPYYQDHRVSQTTIAALIGVMGTMNFLGMIISGWLSDRVAPRNILLSVLAFRGFTLIGLPFLFHSTAGLFAFALLYGLDWAATTTPVIMITNAVFGKQALGTVYGLIFLAHQLGASLTAAAVGVLRAWSGDYRLSFILAGVVAVIASGLTRYLPGRSDNGR